LNERITVVYQEPFHLYLDPFDDKNVYLEYEENGYVCLCIPIETWQALRNRDPQKMEGA
jgi:hypothetical protein